MMMLRGFPAARAMSYDSDIPQPLVIAGALATVGVFGL